MTQHEKKASNSEIILLNPPEDEAFLQTFHFHIHYAILSHNTFKTYPSPVTGFVNVLLVEGEGASSYAVNKASYIIRCGENVLHPIQKGQTFEWKNICAENVAILLFVPLTMLEEFHNKLATQEERFEHGFLTKSDQRIRVMTRQTLDYATRGNPIDKLRVPPLITEILLHQIEGFFAENENHEIIINKNHYDKILLAKKTIDADLSKNYTIHELAKSVGTNEQYLKKYFKQYFGKTVMNYITEAKMIHAKELILTGEYRVSDVASMTGYKHSTHFSTAFKKFFGFIPNSLRYTFIIAQQSAQFLAEAEQFINL